MDRIKIMNTDRLGHIVQLIIAVLGIVLAIKNVVSVVLAKADIEPLVIYTLIDLAIAVGCVRLFCVTRKEMNS